MKRKSIGSAIRRLSLCCVPVVLLPVGSAFGQQIASADFTRAPEPAIAAQDQKKMTLPVGCDKVLPGMIADGFVEPEGHKLPKIMLELTKLSNEAPTVGSELQAEVRLHNSGKQSVRIPWSTDIYKVTDGQGSDRIEWDGGSFQILLRGQQENDVLLKSLTYELYGSTSFPGSLLTIQPGEWASAVIKFKIEAKYPIRPGAWKEGKMQLLVEWRQTLRVQDVTDCKANDRYYRYRYEQENIPLTIQLTREDSNAKPASGISHRTVMRKWPLHVGL